MRFSNYIRQDYSTKSKNQLFVLYFLIEWLLVPLEMTIITVQNAKITHLYCTVIANISVKRFELLV